MPLSTHNLTPFSWKRQLSVARFPTPLPYLPDHFAVLTQTDKLIVTSAEVVGMQAVVLAHLIRAQDTATSSRNRSHVMPPT